MKLKRKSLEKIAEIVADNLEKSVFIVAVSSNFKIFRKYLYSYIKRHNLKKLGGRIFYTDDPYLAEAFKNYVERHGEDAKIFFAIPVSIEEVLKAYAEEFKDLIEENQQV